MFGRRRSAGDAPPRFANDPRPLASFALRTAAMQRAKQYIDWERELRDFLVRDQQLLLWKCAELKEFSRPEETQGEFRVRLEQRASERRDLESEKLRRKFAPRFQTLDDQIQRRAEQRVARESEQYHQKKVDSWLHAVMILCAVLGRKKISATSVGKASTTLRTAGQAAKEHGDIGRAEESLDSLRERLQNMQDEFAKCSPSWKSNWTLPGCAGGDPRSAQNPTCRSRTLECCGSPGASTPRGSPNR